MRATVELFSDAVPRPTSALRVRRVMPRAGTLGQAGWTVVVLMLAHTSIAAAETCMNAEEAYAAETAEKQRNVARFAKAVAVKKLELVARELALDRIGDLIGASPRAFLLPRSLFTSQFALPGT